MIVILSESTKINQILFGIIEVLFGDKWGLLAGINKVLLGIIHLVLSWYYLGINFGMTMTDWVFSDLLKWY